MFHCCTTPQKGRLIFLEIDVLKRNMIFSVDSIYIWSLFNAILCRSLMLCDIFENRKSCQIMNLRPHEISALFSKESSGSSTLCSITLLCFGIAQKHFKEILGIFKKIFSKKEQFSNKIKINKLNFEKLSPLSFQSWRK